MQQSDKKGESQQTPARENVERMRRFAGTATDKSKGGSILSRVSAFSREEAERERKRKEEAAKKKAAPPPKSTEPSRGFVGRMIDKYVYGKKEGS